MEKQGIKRDVNVELLRTLACIIVVMLHVNNLPLLVADKSIVLWKVLLGDGVTIFFMISGFFMFNNDSFKKVLLKVLKTILFPALIITLINGIFRNAICNELVQTSYNFGETIKNILNWKADKGVQHLWYVFSYFKIILLFPVLKLIVEKAKVRRYVIVILLMGVIARDLQHVFNLPLESLPYVFFDESVLCVLIGYEIYNSICSASKRQEQNNLHWLLYGALAFILEIVRIILQERAASKELSDTYLYFWNCGLALVIVSLLIMCVLSINIKDNGVLSKIVIFIGAHSFNIYLVHYTIIQILDRRGFSKTINQMLWNSDTYNVGVTNLQEIAYIFLKGLVVFAISLLISIIIKISKNGLCKLIKTNKTKSC